MFFRKLTAEEEARFRTWARDNYRPGSPIDGCWHPVVQDEARRANEENAIFVSEPEEAET